MSRVGLFVSVGILEILLCSVGYAESMEDVICLHSGKLVVRSDDLQDIVATVPNRTPVKVFQDWGDNKQSGVVRGRRIDFVRVQIDLEDRTIEGWVASRVVRPASSCQSSSPKKTSSVKTKKRQSSSSPDQSGAGLESANCCVFPIPYHPKQSYLNGQRNFGAGRASRLHAACDLKYGDGTPIRAVTDGVVTRSYYRFYKGYNALEVTHTSGFVVRYGEVNSHRASGITEGASVDRGQTIGQMGLMLHFELYSGKAHGSLTTREQPYSRRSDLIDPTRYLQKWESEL